MTIENKNNTQEKQKDIINAGVQAKENMSDSNINLLDQELANLDNKIEKDLKNKINFILKENASQGDLSKGIYLENQKDLPTPDEAVSHILRLKLVTEEEIKTLDKDTLTRQIQTKMYELISKNNELFKALNIYLEKNGANGEKIDMPIAGSQLLNQKKLPASDGKFGPRSMFALSLLIKIPPIENPITPPPEKVEKLRPNNPGELLKTIYNQMRFDENKFITHQLSNVSVGDVTYMRGKDTDKMGMPDGVIMLDTRGSTQNERNDLAMMKRITNKVEDGGLGLKAATKYLIPYRVQNMSTSTNNFTAVIENAKKEGSLTEVPATMDQETLNKTLAEMNAKMK